MCVKGQWFVSGTSGKGIQVCEGGLCTHGIDPTGHDLAPLQASAIHYRSFLYGSLVHHAVAAVGILDVHKASDIRHASLL